MRAACDESVAVGGEEVACFVFGELHLGGGGLGIGEVAGEKSSVGLEGEETAVEAVGDGGRKAIVEIVHTGHSTIALPWCHDGS